MPRRLSPPPPRSDTSNVLPNCDLSPPTSHLHASSVRSQLAPLNCGAIHLCTTPTSRSHPAPTTTPPRRSQPAPPSAVFPQPSPPLRQSPPAVLAAYPPPPTSPPTAASTRTNGQLGCRAPAHDPHGPSLPILNSDISTATLSAIHSALSHRVSLDKLVAASHLATIAASVGIHLSAQPPASTTLNSSSTSFLSALAQRLKLSPSDLIRLARGETASDPRPNKALRPDFLRHLYHDYVHGKLLVDIALFGFKGPWLLPRPIQSQRPSNHGSARNNMPTLLRQLRSGQDAGTYLFVNDSVLAMWQNEILFSPLGLVPKKNLPLDLDGRVIHDLSFPRHLSVNSMTDKSALPFVDWPRIAAVAKRIEFLRQSLGPNSTIKGMVGDVSAAYRHLSASSTDASWFGISIPEVNVIGVDTSAPFGWCGSPNMYCAFGNGISWLVSRESPSSIRPNVSNDTLPFWGFNYIDDHILIEHDTGVRLETANTTLRLAMLATLGPTSLNLKKFSSWSTNLHALGLQWDLSKSLVSMPEDKIAKAQLRVALLQRRGKASRHELEKVIGSLRHVCSCIRPARAFYQNLQSSLKWFPRFGTHTLPAQAIADLDWFATILRVGHLSSVPTSIFADISQPTVTLEMDASDEGLAVLFPAHRLFMRLQWDPTELELIAMCKNHLPRQHQTPANRIPVSRPPHEVSQSQSSSSDFSINVREHFCIVLATAVWGHILADPNRLRTVHVLALTDNTSALAWSSSLASSNVYSQELNRCLGLHQALHHLHVSAAHVPGVINTHPDAGSRATKEPYKSIWRAATAGWTATAIPTALRYAYLRPPISTNPHWPAPLETGTLASGTNGSPFNGLSTAPNGSLETGTNNPPPSLPLHSPDGVHKIAAGTPSLPSSPNSLSSPGITSAPSVTRPPSPRRTPLKCRECNVLDELPGPKSPSPPPSCTPSVNASTSETTSTVSSGGLRSWLSSFFYEGQST